MTTGGSMPRALREDMKSLFGADFTEVRIHELARSPLPAAACTRGGDIYVAAGAYEPGSPEGRRLLGHELAHVLQQRFARVRGGMAYWRLEAEATVAGERVARGEPVRIPGRERLPGRRPQRVTQYYTVVLPANRAAQNIAIPNPQQHAPAQAQDTFVAQVKGGAGALSPGSFLLAAGGVNLNSANAAAAVLRLSANQNMAIEDADASARQPKAFYATQAVIDVSNDRLALLGSDFRLVPDPPGGNQQRITVGVGAGMKTLLRVTPRNVTDASAGFTTTGMQACNQLIEKVAGSADLAPQFEDVLNPAPHLLWEYHVARQVLNPVPPVLDTASALTLANTMRAIAVPYATAARAPAAAFVADLQQYGLNEYAAPEVGEGFVTCTLVATAAGAGVNQGAMPPTYYDHYHLAAGAPQVVQNSRTWGSHWGGVVAKDGADVVTLENYARNVEDALAGSDTRYYFQMYSTNPPPGGAGSWHQAWTTTPMQAVAGGVAPPPAPHPAPTHEPVSPGARSFANPITIRVAVPDARYGAIADTLYGGVNVDTIKNDHNLIAPAVSAHQELRQVLKGLRYANVRLAANQPGDATRVHSWITALTNAVGAARYRGNLPAIRYTHSRLVAMRTT